MKFADVMSDHLYDLRQKIHKLGEKYPEMASHYSLSSEGLFDTETEKLVEKFCYLLTESEANRTSIIANKIKPFMEILFPEWYYPEVSTCIAEFNNFDEIDYFLNFIQHENYITFESKHENKSLYLSSNCNFSLIPMSITKSYFTETATLCHMHLIFKNHSKNKNCINNNKIKIYLHSNNIEIILKLFHYIFDQNFKNSKYKLKVSGQEIELDRNTISMPLFNFKDTTQNVFFKSKNKISIIRDILNKLHHYFYIEINLNTSIFLNYPEFSIHIPLNINSYSEFKGCVNFAKTNCIPIYDIYKENLKNIAILKTNKENYIEISDLEKNGLISISDKNIVNFKTNKAENFPKGINIESSIQFAPLIPYNIKHYISFDDDFFKRDGLIYLKGIFTQLVNNNSKLQGNILKIIGASSVKFGNILSQPTQVNFYSEILSNSEFFSFLYNLNYFIGKKMDNLSMLQEYFEKLSSLPFNYKKYFFQYISEIHIIKWKMMARMNEELEPKIISKYFIKKTNNIFNYFFDRILEKLLEGFSESDLKYEIVRV